MYATFSKSDGRALNVRFLKSSAALKIMARNHLITTSSIGLAATGDCCCKKHSISAALWQHF
jgi:hypothetical protein